jgi:ribulose-5-phosphate 4-epimerase/fuculose-1-phosphate aldolase
MLITPTCVRYETMTADDIVAMNTDGTMVEGKYQPSSEWRMHGVIYEQCDGSQLRISHALPLRHRVCSRPAGYSLDSH